MKRKRTTTLKRKVLISMVLLVFFQIIAILGILLMTGAREKLDSNNVEILCNSVSYKSQTFESKMVYWSDFYDWIEDTSAINATFETAFAAPASTLITDDTYRAQLLEQLSATILPNLRERETTGAFIILSDGSDSFYKDAVYLRDLNPEDTSESNLDILVEAGLGNSGLPEGFTLDICWAERLELDADREFYDKPMQAAADYPEMEAGNLGYWSSAVRIMKNDIEVITYTVPLLDSTHTPYGVIGIEVSLDYLNSYLDGSEITIAENAGYFLGKSVQDADMADTYKTIYVDNIYHGRNLEGKEAVTLKKSGDSTGIRQIEADGIPTGQVCCFSALRLYNTNTPFYDESWIVAGVVDKSQLYESSEQFMIALVIALSLSFAVGILCSLLTTSVMFRPLHQMMCGLQQVSLTTPGLPRSGIVEIDELAIEIERLRHNAFLAGSKAADIIDMSNIALGIYEINRKMSDTVFCTRRFFELTELPLDGWNENYMTGSRFFTLLELFRKKCTTDPENKAICYFTTHAGSLRYLEIKSVIREFEELYVYMDVTSQILEKEKIKHERDYDVLTNLYNRRAFVRSVSRMVDGHLISSGVLSMWDLDNLKYINDTYGHDMGDKYICKLADEFHKLEDAQSVIARISGDEFMVFLFNRDIEKMCQMLEDVHASFLKRKLLLPDGEAVSVSVSAGIAIYGKDSDTYDSLVKLADFSMYEVKHHEKGAIRRFHKDTFEKDYILVQGIGELNKILEEERIHFVFQPIVDIQKKEIYAYEALMRPDSSILYNPELLLRVAEKQSKLRQIEKLTWFLALKNFAAQKPASCTEKLFINSISNQCLTDSEFADLKHIYGSYFPHIVMEITEGVEPDAAIQEKKLAFCKENGIAIAMDDYGTGYNTNSVLINGMFDFVKIDISMVKDIHLSEEKQTFVKGVIEYCHQCNTRVIMEGVETYEEYRMIESLGANYIQGYFLSRPVKDLKNLRITFEP